MIDKVEGLGSLNKEPLWYNKASREAKDDGDHFYKEVLSFIQYDKPKEFAEFGLLHQACVGMAELTYQTSVRSAQHAAAALGTSKSDRHGANRNTYRLVFKLARYLERGGGDISPVIVRDAVEDAIDEAGRAEYGGSEFPDPLRIWRQTHGVQVERIIPELVRWHQQNIENRNRSIKLDAATAMQMPRRFIGKTWEFDLGKGKQTYALHVLETEAQLDLQGVMTNTCVSGDNWKRQIKLRANGKPKTMIFSISREIPAGIKMAEIPGLSAEEIAERAMEAVAINRAFADRNWEGPITQEEILKRLDEKEVKTFRDEAEEKANLKVCYDPLFTIEYNVDSGRILQMRGFGNSTAKDVDPRMHPMLLDVIAELAKNMPLKEVKDAEDLVPDNQALTHEGKVKRMHEILPGDRILRVQEVFWVQGGESPEEIAAWCRTESDINISRATDEQLSLVEEVHGSLRIGSVDGAQRNDRNYQFPRLRRIEHFIRIPEGMSASFPELEYIGEWDKARTKLREVYQKHPLTEVDFSKFEPDISRRWIHAPKLKDFFSK